ncbi:hypothetical protein OJ252_3085 [Cryptosporidium canis]|uniref:tRNA-intron lyase n=1 Tax=Cryptosporidium canis TaxID=195482 RepID=A0ABQ8P3C7_9CRYT|nr:hypothetical protein OJ252_3085 [Cryptosporidium canis]
MDVNRVAELSTDLNELIGLKRERRVLLNPIGTLPKYSQQNVDLGLPIAIMDYQYGLVQDYRRAKRPGHGDDPGPGQPESTSISPGKCIYPENFPARSNIYRIVYEDLVCNYGYYVQQGSKYGFDFVLYEDDPDSCHSSFLLQVIHPSLHPTINVQDLVLWQRVSNKVNKRLIIATLYEDSPNSTSDLKVSYFSLDNYYSNLKIIKS